MRGRESLTSASSSLHTQATPSTTLLKFFIYLLLYISIITILPLFSNSLYQFKSNKFNQPLTVPSLLSCMLNKTPRRRSPAIGSRRRTKPPHPSPSPRWRTRNNNCYKSSSRHHKVLKRCSSAPPVLLSRGRRDDDDDDGVGVGVDVDGDSEFGRYMRTESTLLRPKTFSDAFLSSPSLFPSSPLNHTSKGQYEKEAKVVVNVTVEGSPGPVRTMVKLGSTVDETIMRVVDIYKEQGRSPKLDLNVPLQLHHSHFSLQSLEKSEIIGDVGSRSFYLRKSNGGSASNSYHSEMPIQSTPPLLLPSFIAQKISKIVRRAKRLWDMVVCSR